MPHTEATRSRSRCTNVHPAVYAGAMTRASSGPAATAVSRGDRKERTRRAILDAALSLCAESGLAGLSLRQVAKEVGIVPTAFYRHFASIDEVGLALVDESFVSLREMLRDVRRGRPEPAQIIARSVEVLDEHVRQKRAHFGFIARERVGGTPVVQTAVRQQLDLFERELATDLVRLTGTERWSNDDLQVLANLIVTAMVSTAEAILLAAARPGAEKDIVKRAETQLRMVVVGALNWESDHP
ncbi:MAG: TetR family transcriptional regulator [Marmoricola sp.]|nr:TetR family transcriptional regulator [Marmoricola sp.]